MSSLIRPRAIFFLLAVVSVLGALFPELALLPLRSTVSHMRAPETASAITRWLFVAGTLTFGGVWIAWPRLRTWIERSVTLVAELPRSTYWLIVIALATVPRLLVAAAISYEPVADAWWYHDAATALASGQGLAVDGASTAYRPPGYPFLLSLTYRLFGPILALAWFWGAIATAVIIGTIHMIANRLYGATVARLAALFAAMYPALILMTGQALSDLPFVAGLLLLVAFVLARTPFRLVAAIGIGVAIGLLTLTRGAALGLVAVVPLIWYARRQDMVKAAIAFFVIALAFAATIAPWMARNHAVFGYYTLGTNLGMNAYVGNHRDAPGGAVADHWPSSPQMSSSNEAEVDRELMRMAIGFVASNPWQALAILPRKLMHLYLLETEATTSLFQGEHPSAAWMKYTLYGASQIVYVAFLVLFCLRVLDLGAHSRRPRGAQWTGWLLIGYFTLLCLVFHGEDRYRLPILPWMLIEGSVLLARASKRDNTR